jgi:hypothetical protein
MLPLVLPAPNYYHSRPGTTAAARLRSLVSASKHVQGMPHANVATTTVNRPLITKQVLSVIPMWHIIA